MSAGANAGSHYVAAQRERSHRVFVDLVADPRYAGWRNVVRERSWFGMDFLFRALPDELAPFDYEGFRSSPRTLVSGVTDCTTGAARYYPQHDRDPRWYVQTLLRASCSLPVLSPPVPVDGSPCVDGGVSDSIPIVQAVKDGNPRVVVVLTRNAGYRKPPARYRGLGRVLLARYPAVHAAMLRRPAVYNASLDLAARWSGPARPSSSGPSARSSSAAWSATSPGSRRCTARATTRPWRGCTDLEAWLQS